MAEIGMIGLGHVAIYVKDWKRSQTFYKEKLGFEDLWHTEHDNGTTLHFMKKCGVTIELVQRGGGRKQRDGIEGTINHLCLQVHDIEKAKAALEAEGCVFINEIDHDKGLYPNGEKNVIFLGPDDERLQLEQIL